MEAQDFTDLFLPGFVSQAFDVVNIHSDALRIDIFLDEKKIAPPDMEYLTLSAQEVGKFC